MSKCQTLTLTFFLITPQCSALLHSLCLLATFMGSLTHFAHSFVGQFTERPLLERLEAQILEHPLEPKSINQFLVMCYATLHPALSVHRYVGRSIHWSVSNITFFVFLRSLASLLYLLNRLRYRSGIGLE